MSPLSDPEVVRAPLLVYLHLAGEAYARNVYGPLADYFNLTEEERGRTLEGLHGHSKTAYGRRAWDNRVQGVRSYLVAHGWVAPSGKGSHGVWRLTKKGNARAEALLKGDPGLGRLAPPTEEPPPAATDKAETDDEHLSPEIRALFTTYRYLRDTAVAREAKRLAGFQCQMCRAPGILLAGGGLYAEAHHIVPLHRGGPDALANLLCVCPSCHATLDYLAAEIPPGVMNASPYPVDSDAVDDHNLRVAERDIAAQGTGFGARPVS